LLILNPNFINSFDGSTIAVYYRQAIKNPILSTGTLQAGATTNIDTDV